MPTYGPKQRQSNIGFAKEAMVWEPIIFLSEGLTMTNEYLKRCVKAVAALNVLSDFYFIKEFLNYVR